MKPALMDRVELARYCRELREAAGLSMQALADEMGLSSRQHIYNAESEELEPYLKIRRAIVGHFGGRVDEVYRVTPPAKKIVRVKKNS